MLSLFKQEYSMYKAQIIIKIFSPVFSNFNHARSSLTKYVVTTLIFYFHVFLYQCSSVILAESASHSFHGAQPHTDRVDSPDRIRSKELKLIFHFSFFQLRYVRGSTAFPSLRISK